MINFEEDQANVLQKTDNIRSLADQVERLEALQTRLELQEDNINFKTYIVKHERKNSLRHTRNSRYPGGQA